MLQHAMPRATYCPNPLCHHLEVTTICRFCKTDKLPRHVAPPGRRVHHFTAAPAHPHTPDDGVLKVKFKAPVRGSDCDIMLVVAPPDPEVGLPQPYVLGASVFDAGGAALSLSMPETRALLALVAWNLF